MPIKNLYSVGEIAERLEECPHRVAYIINKHRIRPVHRVGIIRLFNESQVQAIKDGLYNIQVRRS